MDGLSDTSRRTFLKRSGALAALTGLATVASSPVVHAQSSSSTAKPAKQLLSPDEFKQKLVGPIFSVPTPFREDRELDGEGLARGVARAKRAGVTNFAATAGNSQYSSLAYEEVKELTKIMVDAVAGEGLFIAASDSWWTKRVLDFAAFAESAGADALQLMIPQRSGSDALTVAHFKAVASATRLPLVLHGVFSEPLLRELVKIDSIVAMKEDSTLEYYIDRQVAFGKRINIFCGGQEHRFLVGRPYGARAFYSTYTTFAPDISMKFWKAIQANDEAAATEITLKYDYPFIKRFTHSFWHATLEHFGVGKRYLRPPQESYSNEQMADVKAFFDAQGVKPSDYE